MSQYVENTDENEEAFGENPDPDEINVVNINTNKIDENILIDHEEVNDELKPFYKSWLLYFLLVGFGLFIGTNFYFKSQIKIDAPKVDLGEKVVIILDNGQEMKTYENLLVEKEKKVYYKGEFNTIDVSEGIIVYKDWE